MPTILPLAPSALLEPDSALAPSSSTTYIDAPAGTLPLTGTATETHGQPIVYIDAPVGHIGGTIVVGGGGIVKVGGTSVNQQPERKQPRTYPQQPPPRLIHVEYRISHDAPRGSLRLSGAVGETFVPPPVYRVTAGRYQAEPTIQDVIQAQRHARREITRIREKAGQP